jgi:chitodextrinase
MLSLTAKFGNLGDNWAATFLETFASTLKYFLLSNKLKLTLIAKGGKTMKKFLVGLLVGLLLATATPALAGQYQGYKTVKVLVNGIEYAYDVPPLIIDGRMMVPLRFISQALGAKVDWDPINGQAQIEGQVYSPADRATIQSTIQDLAKRYLARAAKISSNYSPTSNEVSKFTTECTQDANSVVSALASIAISPGQDWSQEGVQLSLLNQAIASEWGFWNMYQQALSTGVYEAPKMQAAPMAYWKGLVQVLLK